MCTAVSIITLCTFSVLFQAAGPAGPPGPAGPAGVLNAQAYPPTADPDNLPPEVTRGVRIVWYNVENLFHPADDSLSAADDDFTPGGMRGWTYFRYHRKLAFLAKVIIAAGAGEPPGIVGLCEIEDRKVLEDLISHPILAHYGYECIHADSPDHRGMDVACLYRPGRVELTMWQVIASVEEETRDILHLRFRWARRDSLDLFLVHLISKYRGSGTTARLRRAQAEQLGGLLDSLSWNPDPEDGRDKPGNRAREDGHASRLIVLAGDFNDEAGSYAMVPLQQRRLYRDTILCFPPGSSPGGSPVSSPGGSPGGSPVSYKYHGRWSGIDRFYVSGAGGRYRFRSGVLSHPAMVEVDEAYGGWKPYRTFRGYAYHGGISDHLPVWLDISRYRLFPGLFGP